MAALIIREYCFVIYRKSNTLKIVFKIYISYDHTKTVGFTFAPLKGMHPE